MTSNSLAGAPYKKDDNAHIEQKNWTHVRKLLGYVRYDSAPALTAINGLYEELRLLQNLFLPSVKLVEKRRVGARLRRRYDAPRTPLERVEACAEAAPAQVRALRQLRARIRSSWRSGSTKGWLASTASPTSGSVLRRRRKIRAGTLPDCGREKRAHQVVGNPHKTRFPTAPTRLVLNTDSGNPSYGATMHRSVTLVMARQASSNHRVWSRFNFQLSFAHTPDPRPAEQRAAVSGCRRKSYRVHWKPPAATAGAGRA